MFLVLLPAGYFIWKTFLKEDKVEEEEDENGNNEGAAETKERFILDGGSRSNLITQSIPR